METTVPDARLFERPGTVAKTDLKSIDESEIRQSRIFAIGPT